MTIYFLSKFKEKKTIKNFKCLPINRSIITFFCFISKFWKWITRFLISSLQDILSSNLVDITYLNGRHHRC